MCPILISSFDPIFFLFVVRCLHLKRLTSSLNNYSFLYISIPAQYICVNVLLLFTVRLSFSDAWRQRRSPTTNKFFGGWVGVGGFYHYYFLLLVYVSTLSCIRFIYFIYFFVFILDCFVFIMGFSLNWRWIQRSFLRTCAHIIIVSNFRKVVHFFIKAAWMCCI